VFLGVAIALRDRTFDVHLARTGAARKVGSLVWLGLAAFLNGYFQPLMGINLVQAASAFYILPEFASVTKNSVLLGVPVFPQLQYILGYFEQVAGTKEKSSGDQTSTSTR
jgi:phage-related holin